MRFSVLAILCLVIAGCESVGVPDEPLRGSQEISVSAEAQVRLAERLMAGGDAASAANLYKRAVALEPDNPQLFSLLGKALLAAGRPTEAEGAFRASLDLEPAQVEAARGMAASLLAQGRAEEALALLDADTGTGQGAGQDTRMVLLRGTALDLLARHDEAQALYRGAIAAAPRDISLRTNLALSLGLEGDFDEAIELARQAATDPAATTRHRRNYVLILAMAGDRRAAEKVAAASSDPKKAADLVEAGTRIASLPDSRSRAAAVGVYGGL
jgi:Flp pilus assembly protein TadD